jgi:ATP-dependent DNA helicase PIF1
MQLTTNMRVDPEEIDFSNFLLQVGSASHSHIDPDRPHIMEIPSQFLVANLDALIEAVFPHITTGYNNQYFLANRSILTPLNESVDAINSICVNAFPGEAHTYLSADSVQQDDKNLAIPIEYLNSLTPSGMPPHKLTLKLNIVVMLLRNLQAGPREGLRNGTRLLIKSLGMHMLECEVLTGTSKGITVFLPRIPLILRDSDFPFTMIRKQFPIRPCFSMSINKSQGQTLDMVGLYLPSPVFTHGQLYVAFSRVRRQSAIKICLGEDEDSHKGWTSNIVFKSII